MMRKIITSILLLTSLVSWGQNPAVMDLWKMYNSGDFKTVIEKAKPMLDNEPQNLDLNLMLGRSFSSLGDYQAAVPYLDYTVKNDMNNSWLKGWALAYLGNCYFMLQKYADSEKSINACIQLNATKNATDQANGLSLLFGMNEFYKNWTISESEHFRYHFQQMDQVDREKFIALREKAYTEINGFFKSTLPKKIDFYVWQSREDALRILKTPLGFAKPEFCVVHTHFQQTLGHEMTHILSHYTSKTSKKTRLINEGTAVCFDLTHQDRLKIVQDWLKTNNKQVAIKDCWENGNAYADELLYPLSGLFVKELLDQFGKDKFLVFIQNQTYDNAKLVFGDSLDQVIQDFEKKINS